MNQKKHIYVAEKIIIIFLSSLVIAPIVSLIVYLIVYLFWSITFPASPKIDRAKYLLHAMSYYDIPTSFKLVYSKHYQDLLSSNICFVFSYPEGYYDVVQDKNNYLNQNYNHENMDFINDFDINMIKNQGCSKFMSKLETDKVQSFIEYDYRYQPDGSGRGLKIFVNDKDNLVMFEGYLYD